MKWTGMAWRGVLCAGLIIALGACGGPPQGHPKGGDDDYSQGPGDNYKHDRDGDSGGDDLKPSRNWHGSSDLKPAHGGGEMMSDSSDWGGGKGGDDTADTAEDVVEGTDGSSEGGDEIRECKEKKLIAVALEGEIAPGTCYDRFDPVEGVDSTSIGMASPQTNDHGDVAFIGSYGGLRIEATVQGETPTQDSQHAPDGSDMRICLPEGAGIFAYDNDDYGLRAIARTGQETPAGYFPENGEDYSTPSINDADDIAFSARNLVDGYARSALFVGNVENQDLTMIAAQGDEAPGCGFFDQFYDVSINNDSNVAFIASYYYGTTILGAAETDGGTQELEPVPPSVEPMGVFLAKKGCRNDEIKPVALFGQRLEGTGGGRLCGAAGPWMNDRGDVLFQATCIYGGTRPGLEGSIFIRRHGEHDLDPFVLIGDEVDHSYVAFVGIGRPGVNDEEAGLVLVLQNAGSNVVIATKKLDEHSCEPEVCAENGQYIHKLGQLQIGEDFPSIARDGTLAFTGYFGLSAPAVPATDLTAPQDVTTDSIPIGPRAAILTCRHQDIDVIAVTGGKKPLPKDYELPVPVLTTLKTDGNGTDGNCSEYDFRFGFLDQPSNANGYVTFRDSREFPEGIFLSEPHCGDAD